MAKQLNVLRRYNIGILLIDDFALMCYSSIIEPLRAANLLAGEELYRVDHITASPGQAVSSSGAIVKATADITDEKTYDLVLVVAGGDPTIFEDNKIFQWLRQKSRHGVRLGGVSGGPFILAKAGLMEGRRMTIHWEHVEALSELSSALLIERSLFVMDRDRITCAGGVAPMDMMYAVQSEVHGPEFARKVSDWFIYTDVRPSEAPLRSGVVERYGTNNPSILQAIEAMENHIADPLSLNQLALLSSVSPRQLNRLFLDKMGQSTMNMYRELRLKKAHSLLLQTVLSITEIALATGFSSSAHLSKCFHDKYGFPPSTLRKKQKTKGV